MRRDEPKILNTTNTIVHYFEYQAKKRPKKIALIEDQHTIPYKALNDRANRLAHYLIQQDIKHESLVAVYLTSSIDFVIAALAILKAGGAYVPIDHHYPSQRIEFILNDTQAPILLTTKSLGKRFQSLAKRMTYIDDRDGNLQNLPAENPKIPLKPTNLCYVIYTSGSTGNPKGVLVEHRSVINLVNHPNYVHITYKDRFAQISNIGFDAATFEIWGALLNGATLVSLSKNTPLSAPHLKKFFQHNKISTIFLTTALFNELVLSDPTLFATLNYVFTGGEAHNPQIMKKVLAEKKQAPKHLVSVYGPTECTTFSTYYPIHRIAKNQLSIPIGKAVSNTKLWVVNQQLDPVQPGEIGELLIFGDGLARGYLNQSQLTSEKFITFPFKKNGMQIAYKSGDLVKQLPNGNIDFIGRMDNQVKIRGFRVELDEINLSLSQYPIIQTAITLLRQKDNLDKELVAYLVVNRSQKLNLDALRKYLKQHLPAYMIPSAYIILDKMPLTVNGKIDTEQLKSMPHDQYQYSTDRRISTSDTEKLLLEILSNVTEIPTNNLGVQNNFFNLGLHSLSIIRLTTQINHRFGSNLILDDVFKHASIKKLASVLKKKQSPHPKTTIISTGITTNIPLTHQQQLIFYHQAISQNALLYNEPLDILFNEPINLQQMETAIAMIIQRHDILRTKIIVKKGIPTQLVDASKTFKLSYRDLSELPLSERKSQTLISGTRLAKKKFHLHKAPLIRFLLIKLSSRQFRLFITAHHIIIDGTSLFEIFYRELNTLYHSNITSRNALPSPLVQYQDYATFQQTSLNQTANKIHKVYWKKRLSHFNVFTLPCAYITPPRLPSYEGNRLTFKIQKPLATKIKSLAQAHQATLFACLLCAFKTLLYRYTQTEDISIGSVVSDRHRPEIENTLGNFINTLIIRSDFSNNLSFIDLLAQTQNNLSNDLAHHAIPFQELLTLVKTSRPGITLPFEIAFIFEPTVKQINPRWAMNQMAIHTGIAKFPLTMELDDRTHEIIGRIEYNTALYDKMFIDQFIQHYLSLLENIIRQPHLPIRQLSFLTKQDNKKLAEWNQTQQKSIKTYTTVCEWFEYQADKTPHKTALEYNNQSMTYQMLNAKANQLAHYLKTFSIKTESRIALAIDRGFDKIISILAVLKAGAAYIPIDINYPKERIHYILQDSRPSLLLTQTKIKHSLPGINKIKTIDLDQSQSKIDVQPTDNLKNIVKKNDLAYVIYTSGSTGKPKGVMIEHRGIVNLVNTQIKQFRLTPHSRVLSLASFGFDAFVSELFTTLLAGGALILTPKEEVLPGLPLEKAITQYRITHATIFPFALNVTRNKKWPYLKTIISAGEPCTQSIIEKWGRDYKLINAYGPTETTVCASMSSPLQPGDTPHIGRPLTHTQVYILDSHLQKVPIGIKGELYISGIHLARGYLNRPDLTHQKFIRNPYHHNQNKLYKTGDFVYWDPKGHLNFSERMDTQIKFRGYRIELTEIESALRKHPKIQDCIVIKKEHAHKEYLAAYFSAHHQSPNQDASVLREYLKKIFPLYMIPSYFIQLQQLPLSPHGKIDKTKLPEPEKTRSNLPIQKITTKHNKLETMLIKIFRSLLKTDQINIEDDFFDWGGDSITAFQLIAAIKRSFHVELNLQDIITTSTIEAISRKILKQKNQNKKSAAQQDSFIVPFRKAGNKSPLFLVHPIGGTVFCYLHLAQQLNPDRPFYGIADPGIESKKPMFSSLKDMASYYVKAIQRTQPHGPYFLGGASSGATVAIEMANQLQATGEKIAAIFLLDGWAFYPKTLRDKKFLEKLLLKEYQHFQSQFLEKGIKSPSSLLKIQHHRSQLIENYTMKKPIEYPLVLFKATRLLDYLAPIQDPYNHWQKYNMQPLELYHTPGNHNSMFDKPHVSSLAKQLNHALNKIESTIHRENTDKKKTG
ncbi:MAG: hypothetical protein A2X77_05430 [Gammaproteobacteria bacterium GWE2_42_36]|nr:MAG: hypothetical protein A2X77_05430 [Gammaproteobacteria bacterium GWE2_42_36]HCU05125.1 hypothetical protein [Coxiellaceae bacterium]